MQDSTRRSSPGYLFGLGATVMLSFTGILISYLSRAYHLPSLVLAFWRELFVVAGLTVAFALFSRWRFRLNPSFWSFFLLYGLTLAVFNSMWTFSVQYNGAAVATVLAFSSPAMTAVLAHFILREHITRVKVVAIILSLVGIVLVSGAADPAAWQVNAAGIVFGLLTGLLFACYTMIGKTSSNKGIDPWTTMLYGFGTAVCFLFVFNVLFSLMGGQDPVANFLWLDSAWGGWAVLILLGIGPTIGGYGLYLVSLGYLSATVANLIGALEPAFTALWAYLLFQEQLTAVQIFGSMLVFASVILLRFGEERKIASVVT